MKRNKKITFSKFLVVITIIVIHLPYALGSSKLLPEAIICKRPITKSQWIWNGITPVSPNSKSYFRTSIVINEPIKSAILKAFYDDKGIFYLNGKRQKYYREKNVIVYDISNSLKSGENTLAFFLENVRSAAGLFFYGRIILASGRKIDIHSNSKVKSSATAQANWFGNNFNDSSWKPAREQGDALSYPWLKNLKPIKSMASPKEQARYRTACLKVSQLPAGLDSEPEPIAKIVYKGQLPQIEINGKIYPPVLNLCDSGNEFTDNIAIKTYQAGVRIFQIAIPSNQFINSSGPYDFRDIDFRAARMLNLNPDAYLLLSIHFRESDMQKWCRSNPDETIGFVTGPTQPSSSYLYGRPLAISAASNKFRNEVQKMIKTITKHVKKSAWNKRLIGVRVTFGIFTEWHTFGMYAGPDSGKRMTEAFRKYLKKKYKTDSALRNAYRNKKVTFDTITVPNIKERWGMNRYLRDPVAERKTWDYYNCHNNVMADLLLFMAKTVKDNLPDRLCGAYYGYAFASHPPEGANVLLEKIVSSPYIDFLSNPPPYTPGCRRAGGSFMQRTIPATFHRYGKLAIIEDDSRFHFLPKYTEKRISSQSSVESEMIERRNFCNMIFDGAGLQILDPCKNVKARFHTFDSLEVIKAIQQSIAIYKSICSLPCASGNDIAAVFNPDERIHHGGKHRTSSGLSKGINCQSISQLFRTGYGFDVLSLKDFLVSKRNYKTVIFLNPFSFFADERKLLIKKVRKPNMTSIWTYAPGYVTPKGFNVKAMQELTGIKLAADTNRHKLELKFKNGIKLKLKGTDTPRIHSIDPDVKVLAHYTDDDTNAVVIKKFPDKSQAIFTGLPVINSHIWNKLLHMTSAHQYVKPGNYFRHHANMIMVHVGAAGTYSVNLPQQAKSVTELYSGKIVAKNTSKFALKAVGPMTWLLKINL